MIRALRGLSLLPRRAGPLLAGALAGLAVIGVLATAAAAQSFQTTAPHALLMDADTGTVLFEKAADEPFAPASMAKLMTLEIIFNEMKQGRLDMDSEFVISENAWRKGGGGGGGSSMFAPLNSRVKLSDLLRGIIVQSGNDASIALAEHLAGSEETFAAMMNQEAKRLGLADTQFVNATGWPAEGHYSSALDMAKLARAIVIEDPDHYAMYAEKEFVWSGIKQPNRNLLLWRDPSVDGLKTGHTEEAGYCLVASAKRDGMRLVAAVFGTESEAARATETATLLGYGFRFFENKTFHEQGEVVTQAPLWKGAARVVKAGVSTDLAVTVARGTADTLSTRMVLEPKLMAPVKQGQVIGKIEVLQGEKVLNQADVVAMETIEEGGFFRRVWDSIRLFFKGIFG